MSSSGVWAGRGTSTGVGLTRQRVFTVPSPQTRRKRQSTSYLRTERPPPSSGSTPNRLIRALQGGPSAFPMGVSHLQLVDSPGHSGLKALPPPDMRTDVCPILCPQLFSISPYSTESLSHYLSIPTRGNLRLQDSEPAPPHSRSH